MKKNILIISVVLCVNLIYASSEKEKALYFNLHDEFIKWHEGLFGSASFYHRSLFELLNKSIGKYIITEYDYVYIDTAYKDSSKLRCRFSYDGWLIIETAFNSDTMNRIKKNINDNGIESSWLKSSELISIRGIIVDFKMDRKDTRENITLFIKNTEVTFIK